MLFASPYTYTLSIPSHFAADNTPKSNNLCFVVGSCSSFPPELTHIHIFSSWKLYHFLFLEALSENPTGKTLPMFLNLSVFLLPLCQANLIEESHCFNDIPTDKVTALMMSPLTEAGFCSNIPLFLLRQIDQNYT